MNSNHKTVLIVEDDDNSRIALRTVLEARGYRVFEASSALEAVGHLYRNERPDLILLDIRLPGKGGDQFRTELRANSLFSRIPVIATSAHVAEISDLENYAAIFEKPLDTAKLLERISAILGLVSR